jgi:ribosomal protein S18 acetylase RimI-like enzyme
MDVRPLEHGEEARALELLSREPVRNVIMRSLLGELGLDGARPRGTFYGCFRGDELSAVALVGRFVFLDGGEHEARAFARVARLRHAAEPSVLLAEPRLAEVFEGVLAGGRAREAARPESEPNLLLALDRLVTPESQGVCVRPARPEETEEVAQLHVCCSMALHGIDPSAQDPEGFRERVGARVREGRVWVCRDERGVVFKADLAAQAGGVMYLEGVITRPDLLGTGVGTKALGSLCRRMLARYERLCLLVAEGNRRALDFYRRIGFDTHCRMSLLRYRTPHAAAAPAQPSPAGRRSLCG